MTTEKLLCWNLSAVPADDDFNAATVTATRTGGTDVVHGVCAHSLPPA
jgi:hypothetical protein